MPTASPPALMSTETPPETGRNPAMLSVRVFKKGSRFGWTVHSPREETVGCGTVETELKAGAEAFQAGMIYIERLKGRSAPDDTNLH
jgi:hypothetical protein